MGNRESSFHYEAGPAGLTRSGQTTSLHHTNMHRHPTVMSNGNLRRRRASLGSQLIPRLNSNAQAVYHKHATSPGAVELCPGIPTLASCDAQYKERVTLSRSNRPSKEQGITELCANAVPRSVPDVVIAAANDGVGCKSWGTGKRLTQGRLSSQSCMARSTSIGWRGSDAGEVSANLGTQRPSPVPPTEGSDGADSGIANTGEPENVLDIMPPPPPSPLAWDLSSRAWLDDHSLGLYRSSTWSKGGSDSRDYLSDWGEDGDATGLLGDCTIHSESGVSITEVVADCRVPRGGVRKTGCLWFKHLLHCKGRKVEIVPRRKWRRSWIVLRGCSLQFFERRPEGSEEPKFVLGVSEALVQACPEHPRREFVLCLSNNVGNVIIFQAGSQTELETWITAIHSACASRFASHCAASMRPAVLDMFEETGSLKDMSLGPHSALRIEIYELKQQIELDEKMKNDAMLKLEEVCDRLSRKAILEQVSQWEQNLERLGLDLFRLRCYLASLEGLEPPNPKAALTLATRSKKESMHRLRLASVSCLHALVSTQEFANSRQRTFSHSLLYKKRSMFSSLRGLDAAGEKRATHPRVTTIFRGDEDPLDNRDISQAVDDNHDRDDFTEGASLSGSSMCAPVNHNAFGQQLCVVVPGGATVSLLLLWHHTACDVLHIVCQAQDLQPSNYVLCMRSSDGLKYLPNKAEQLLQQLREDMELVLTSDETLLAPLAHPVQADTTNGLCTSPVDTSRTPQGTQLPGQTRAYEEKIADMGEQSPPGQLSDADRLWKVIIELVETERSYVKDLKTLEEVYVRPLQQQSYLSAEQHEVLFGQLNGLQNFQLEFLQTLEQGLALAPTPTCCTQLGQFRRVLFSLGGSFLYYSDHFKLYSAYCASQPKAQRLLEQARKDEQLQRFLASQNPLGQHSSTLESFLIKPIQRVLKYPLLLRELVSLTDPESEENYHLSEALRAMNKVASHINEMQKIYEEFCPLLEKLASQHAELQNEPVELGMGDLLMNAQVVWLNPPVSLGQLKHLPEAHVFVFKKAVALICKDVSKQRKRKDDQDSSLFQYLIPVTALHVRALNDPELENAREWDLIHMKSETVGRPETVFRLCSRSVESKAQALRAARSLLRECARQRLNKSSSVPAKVPGYMPFGGRRLSALRARQQRATGMQRHLCRHSSDGLSQLGLGGEGGSVEEEGRGREAVGERGSTNSTTALYRSEPELAIHHYCDSDDYDDVSNAASVRQPAITNDLQADGGSRKVCTNLDMPTVMVQLSLDEAEVRKDDVLSNVDTLQSCGRQMQQSDGTTRDRKSPLTMHSGSDESLNSILSEAGTLEVASDRWHSDAE